MYVGRIMHTRLVTVPPDTSLRKAKEIIEEKKINHLLVVNKNEDLVGLVSDRDVKQSWASPATTLSVHELNYLLTQLTVENIMVKKIITISPGTRKTELMHCRSSNLESLSGLSRAPMLWKFCFVPSGLMMRKAPGLPFWLKIALGLFLKCQKFLKNSRSTSAVLLPGRRKSIPVFFSW